ncbi:TIGR04282 family arsenosugar biosynthesis glycosyltransferase [Mariprofundus sp. NF]|uniref:TIGR04282 family arsenosugar biosynthesis glycosyltransferase n=1 Tax=Mariprofundus sp. NF TaxID=2608716 RepID=UPI001F5080BA|nr:TIGR04282 family arsenosugar biosynthesis glycosyltransferase [Mariprofundus sp. NF]
MKVSGIGVVVMCKAPLAGRVKTRLMTEFSASRAAELHAAMATTVIKRAKRLFESVVVAADDPGHPFFSAFGVPVTDQGEGDLGDRMQRQVSSAFADGADAVMLLGTDSPHMADQRLLTAARLLKENDVVLGPVEDGGYDLLAMRADYPLFENVNWSTAEVVDQTLAHIDALSLSYALLDLSFDVDLPEDIQRAVAMGWQIDN